MSNEPEPADKDRKEDGKKSKLVRIWIVLVFCAGAVLAVGALYLFYPLHAPPKTFVWGIVGFNLFFTLFLTTQHEGEGCVILVIILSLGLMAASAFWHVHQLKVALALHKPASHSHMPALLWCLIIVEPVLTLASARIIIRIDSGEWFP